MRYKVWVDNDEAWDDATAAIDELRDEIIVAPVTSRAVRASKGGRR